MLKFLVIAAAFFRTIETSR